MTMSYRGPYKVGPRLEIENWWTLFSTQRAGRRYRTGGVVPYNYATNLNMTKNGICQKYDNELLGNCLQCWNLEVGERRKRTSRVSMLVKGFG